MRIEPTVGRRDYPTGRKIRLMGEIGQQGEEGLANSGEDLANREE